MQAEKTESMQIDVAVDEMVLLQKKYEGVDREKMRAWLLKKGLPIEVVTRLDDLWDATTTIAGHVLRVSKIIFCRILEFIKTYPNTAIGILIGAAIGALVNAVPFLGPMLAPITTALGAIAGAVAGAQLDTGKDGLQSIIIVAKEFFMMLIDIFKAIFNKNNQCAIARM